jgi:oligopeptide transport system ATP-binding protein
VTESGDLQPLVDVRGVSKIYGGARRGQGANLAVSSVSFSLKRGEILGIVGESGSGKSTLARCIADLLEPSSGIISFEGKPLANLTPTQRREVRRNMQMVFQDPYASLNPRKRIEQIVGEPLRSYGVPRKLRSQQVREILTKVGLAPEDALAYPRAFSGGQRQRIGIARAMVLEPSLLIADEPVSSLDVSIQAQILNLLMDLRAERQLAILFISHDLAVVRHVADRVLVMYRGTVVESGTAAQLYAQPAHPYTQLLLSAAPGAGLGGVETWAELEPRTTAPEDELAPRGCSFQDRCPYVEDACRLNSPPLEPVGGGQSAACYFPLTGGGNRSRGGGARTRVEEAARSEEAGRGSGHIVRS